MRLKTAPAKHAVKDENDVDVVGGVEPLPMSKGKAKRNSTKSMRKNSDSTASEKSNTYVYTPEPGSNYSTSYYQSATPQYAPHSYIVSPVGNNTTASSICGGGSPGSTLDADDVSGISPTTRASPATLQWLLQNYETADGTSLPRCTLYDHYQKHCRDHHLDPVNAASFGKLIRSVFLGLRTRRLGTRGNSKYHYYGIRIKNDSPLARVGGVDMNGGQAMNMGIARQTIAPGRRHKRNQPPQAPQLAAHSSHQLSHDLESNYDVEQMLSPEAPSPAPTVDSQNNHMVGEAQIASDNGDGYTAYLGDGQVPNVNTPITAAIEEHLPPLGLTAQHVVKFVNSYQQQCEGILEAIRQLDVNEVTECWRSFWQPEVDGFDEAESTELTQEQIFALCNVPEVLAYVEDMDTKFYQVIVDIFIPNVLKKLPGMLITTIRSFGKNLESGLANSMQGAPIEMMQMKLGLVRSLAHTLRRYTSLNHLAEAARGVLVSDGQVSQMAVDISRVDLEHLNEQAAWLCDCPSVYVEQVQSAFKENLGQKFSIEQWSDWLAAVVEQVLNQHEHRPSDELVREAKQFYLKWIVYSEFIMRDITLRSAPSFGSFHLIRLLFDEFMFYAIVMSLGRRLNLTTIAVMNISGMQARPSRHVEQHVSSVFESPNADSAPRETHVRDGAHEDGERKRSAEDEVETTTVAKSAKIDDSAETSTTAL